MSSEEGVSKELQKIIKIFDKELESNPKIRDLLKRKKSYLDASEYAIELGNILSSVLTMNTTADSKEYISEILNNRLKNNHNLIVDYGFAVQEYLNKQANINLKPQIIQVKQDKIDGIVNRLVNESFEKIKWILGTPIVTYSQSVVDRMVEKNAKFHYDLGLSPRIIRKEDGDCCKWCKNLVGVYKYPDVPKDVYRRHGNCGCTVEYIPKDGKTKQNVHTKKVKPIIANSNDNLPYKSVKAEWLKNYKEPKVSDAEYWEYEGIKYFVDGKKVILDYSIKEKEIAYLISNKFGVEVLLNPKIHNPKNIPSPDYLINGMGYDLKEITNIGKNNIDTAIKSGKKQARNFVLDYTESGLSREDIDSRLNRLYQNPHRKWVENIILIKDNNVEDIIIKK